MGLLANILKRKSPDELLAVSSKTELKKTEKFSEEEFLNAVASLLPRKGMEWSGSATELACGLESMDIAPSVLTRKLNEASEKLRSEYGVEYERVRTHNCRLIKLTRREPVSAGKTKRKKAKKKGETEMLLLPVLSYCVVLRNSSFIDTGC